ncbi:MAG: hypothetical protein M1831_003136 [Alyxoria varia]|nr:MAG: hypothetical protein M1831_003136 [Alyxoria varia]
MSTSITVNGNTIDASLPQYTSINAPNVSNFIYVKGKQAPSNTDLRTLIDKKVQVQEYIFDSTYMCKYSGDLKVIRQLPFVQLANVYSSDLKTAQSLKSSIKDKKQATYIVDVLLHRGAVQTPKDLSVSLSMAAQVKKEDLRILTAKIRLTIDPTKLSAIEKLDDVNRIEEVIPKEPANDVARQILNVDVMLGGWPVLLAKNQGEEQTIAIADTGIYQDHPAFKGKNIQVVDFNKTPEVDPAGVDPTGHGTHVCASAIGSGVTKDKTGKEILLRGSAPNVKKLIMQSLKLYWPADKKWYYTECDDMVRLLTEADALDARIHSNSHNKTFSADGPQIGYDSDAAGLDRYTNEVYQGLVVLFSAGNCGHMKNNNKKLEQIGGAAAAKNCITVGATGSTRVNDSQKYGATDFPATGPATVAPSSSRGPTTNGRIKPDVVAPGVTILSAASPDMAKYTNPLYPGSTNEKKRTDDKYGVWDDPNWRFDSGTSMATPHVAGCVAIFRQAINETRQGDNPSASLLKALLINGAFDLEGTILPDGSGGGTPTPKAPNNIQGFGRVDVAKSILMIDRPKPGVFGFVDGGNPTVTGTSDALKDGQYWKSDRITLQGSKTTFKATLAYPDPTGALLQNNLNLVIHASDGTERHGNMGIKPDFDNVNNVEKVVWENIPPGVVTIEVKAQKIPPFTRTDGSIDDAQTFAVAWMTEV